MSNKSNYHVELEFFAPVDTEAKESKWAVGQRNVQFFILKKDKDAEFWPRLLEDKMLEKTNVKVDWSKFADEDDEEAEQGFDTNAMGGGAGGFDINQMMAQQQMMGGAGGAGGGMPDMASMMGGAGGAGGGMPDMASMMAQMQQGGMGAGAPADDDEDSDDEDLPDLEQA